MISALTRGKLSTQQENMEDILTSCVFDALRLVNPADGVIPLLSDAIFWSDKTRKLGHISSTHSHEAVGFDFWPRYSAPGINACEPDVVITFEAAKAIVLIEAKLHSEKSSYPDDDPFPNDQLAREWDQLLVEAERLGYEPFLVYLTTDVRIPRASIKESVEEFTKKRPGLQTPQIYWLPWCNIQKLTRLNQKLRSDFDQLIQRLGIGGFGSWQQVTPVPVFDFGDLTQRLGTGALSNWKQVKSVPVFEFQQSRE